MSEMTKAEMRAILMKLETKMDRQQTELKQLLRKYDEKLIEIDIRLRACLGKDSD